METILGNARAPATKPVDEAMAQKDKRFNKKRCEIRLKQLYQKKSEYEKRWKAIRDYQLPFVGQFDDTADGKNPAKRRDAKIYNGVAWESCQIFAGGVMSGLTPPSRPWFRLAFPNRQLADNAEASELLDERMEILMDILNKSNFYNAVHSVYLELPFGQCPMGIFQSAKTGVHFMPFTIGTYALDVSADGLVNTFARKYTMTAAQLEQQFGAENMPNKVKDALRNMESKYSTEFTVCWIVEPNEYHDEEKEDKYSYEYKSMYWVEGSEKDEWLYVGGFKEWPIPTARYLIHGLEAYGKGPGWFAEGDSKVLQTLEKDDLIAVELGMRPPMQAPSEAANKGINLVPGASNIVEGNADIRPLFKVEVNIDHLNQKIKTVEDKIKRSYNADLFLMLDQLEKGQMTAREIMERTQEKMQQLGPVVQRMQFEFLTPIIERVYGVLERGGAFPPASEELQQILDEEEIKIEYISPLAQAQKMSGLVNIEQAVAFLGQLAQMYPDVLAKLNYMKTIDRYFDMVGAPAPIKRSQEEVEQMQQAQQEAEAKQKQLQEVQAIAQTAAPAAQAAKNLTEAAQDGNAALANWMGMG